jgi:hypothetical protein
MIDMSFLKELISWKKEFIFANSMLTTLLIIGLITSLIPFTRGGGLLYLIWTFILSVANIIIITILIFVCREDLQENFEGE